MATLSDFRVSNTEIQNYFFKVYAEQNINKDLMYIFQVALNTNLSPNINLGLDATYMNYIDRWIKNYRDADENPPGKRIASVKNSCNDPAVKSIIMAAKDISLKEAGKLETYHNLFMSAENIQGQLLEEYISLNISKFGFLWCKGNTLQSVDFCSKDGKYLLQIKNKSNTENSSSNKVRFGTSIIKWYRLGTQMVHGSAVPVYKWDLLNKIILEINNQQEQKCNMNENDYMKFIKKVVTENPQIIIDR